MKKVNKKIIFILALVLLSAFVVIAGIVNKKQAEEEAQKESYLIPREVSKELWRRQLEIDESAEKNLVQNIYDGYKIELSKDWQYEDVADPIGGFTAYILKEGVETDIFQGLEDGVVLSIHTIDNPQKMSAVDWLSRSEEPANYLLGSLTFEKVSHPNEEGVYRSSHKVFAIEAGESHEHSHTENTSADPSSLFVHDSAKVNYVFAHKDKLYVISCASMAEAYAGLVHTCEQQIQTFEILD